MQVEQNRQWVLRCPPYLIGLATLFWGVMVEHELVGFALAIFFEGFNFVKTRWNFTYNNYVRAWHMSVLVAVFIGFIYLLDGAKMDQMRVVFEWLPLIFSPLLFVQRYGEADVMPMNTFSFIARYRMKLDIQEGRPIRPYMINFSSAFFGIVVLAAGLKKRPANFYDLFAANVSIVYVVGAATLIGLFTFCIGRKHGQKSLWFGLVYLLMISISFGFLKSLNRVEQLYGPRSEESDGMDINESMTSIGSLEDLKLSKKVKWRMWVPNEKPRPERVPFAIYNIYDHGNWSVSYMTNLRHRKQFDTAASVNVEEDEVHYFGDSAGMVKGLKKENAYRFLSTLDYNKSSALMPHLNGYFAFGGLVGEEASIEKTKLGSVQIYNPEKTLHCYLWNSRDEKFQFSKPLEVYDTRVTSAERGVVAQVVDELGLREMEPKEKIEALRRFFLGNFTYTKHLNFTGDRDKNGKIQRTALSKFLTETREGHCEYFATAATLMLREAGVPARYVNGYAVRGRERQGDALLLRGDQAHAWCHAWIGDRWIDVDLTPPDWQEQDFSAVATFGDKVSDWWRMMLEDFQVWREAPENATVINKVIMVVIGVLVVWIFLRLWFAKNRNRTGKSGSSADLPNWKVMKKFDRWCTGVLGPRPVGMAYGRWVGKLAGKLPEKKQPVGEFVRAYHEARFSGETEDLVGRVSKLAKQIMKR